MKFRIYELAEDTLKVYQHFTGDSPHFQQSLRVQYHWLTLLTNKFV